ncbi:hypothetical protein ACT4S5_13320 [Kocuria oceani]|uniref:hypothetical protein n=1 Tax=Kocuria oceani TaxID=988827 RepID=UPI0040355B7C
MPILAKAFRDLIGTRGYTAGHYEALTASWRVLVGRVHPEDADLADPTEELVMSRQIVSLWQFATAELTFDAAMADRMLDARLPLTRRPPQRPRGDPAAGLRGVLAAGDRQGLPLFNDLDRTRREECMSVLRDLVLALVVRDRIADDFFAFTQADYVVLTTPWRQQIGAISPNDRALF